MPWSCDVAERPLESRSEHTGRGRVRDSRSSLCGTGSGCLSIRKLTRHHTVVVQSPDPRADRLRRNRNGKTTVGRRLPPPWNCTRSKSRNRNYARRGIPKAKSIYTMQKFNKCRWEMNVISLINSQMCDNNMHPQLGVGMVKSGFCKSACKDLPLRMATGPCIGSMNPVSFRQFPRVFGCCELVYSHPVVLCIEECPVG